jgi:hypothetical protein
LATVGKQSTGKMTFQTIKQHGTMEYELAKQLMLDSDKNHKTRELAAKFWDLKNWNPTNSRST